MKICLYLEFREFMGGALFKNIGTGLLSSYQNQKRILEELNIETTEHWDDSCDILQINTPWLNSIRLIKKARSQGKKVIIWSHVTIEDAKQVFRIMSFVAPLFGKYLKYAYNLADIVFCPSEYTKSLLINYGISEKKLVVMSNGTDLVKFHKDEKKRDECRKEYDLHGMVVGTVGLVIPRKGVDTFLDLAIRFPENAFYWFGKIYSSMWVKPLPKQIPSNTKFTGYVNDIVACMNSLDIFIFPSYEENQGMVILEAAALGLPIVVRDIPVYNGWLRHGENCLKAKNTDEFQQYIGYLLKDKELRAKLSYNALKLSREESIETISKRTKAVYLSLIG